VNLLLILMMKQPTMTIIKDLLNFIKIQPCLVIEDHLPRVDIAHINVNLARGEELVQRQKRGIIKRGERGKKGERVVEENKNPLQNINNKILITKY
jgi:hypothetical protein